MANAEPYDLTTPVAAPVHSARSILARRLADIVCLPSSRLSPQERWIVGDLLFDIMRNSDATIRRRCAQRLAGIAEAPTGLLRLLACDEYEVARPILEDSEALTDFDMMEIARAGSLEHRLALARRTPVSETLTAALTAFGEPPVVIALLKNPTARLAAPTVDHVVAAAKDEAAYAPLLIKRAELRPAQAFRLFWVCGHKERMAILDRFGVDRTILIDAADDIFPLAAAEGGQDVLVKRTLAYIDRRQRNRAAAAASPYGSLEGAIQAMASEGPTPELVEECARLAGIGRPLLEWMLDDLGGEPPAVLCKATGAGREDLKALWTALGRPAGGPVFDQALYVYDRLSVEKAQTVLRYWNWTHAARAAAE